MLACVRLCTGPLHAGEGLLPAGKPAQRWVVGRAVVEAGAGPARTTSLPAGGRSSRPCPQREAPGQAAPVPPRGLAFGLFPRAGWRWATGLCVPLGGGRPSRCREAPLRHFGSACARGGGRGRAARSAARRGGCLCVVLFFGQLSTVGGSVCLKVKKKKGGGKKKEGEDKKAGCRGEAGLVRPPGAGWPRAVPGLWGAVLRAQPGGAAVARQAW